MRRARPTHAPLHRGAVPIIACFNHATTPLGVSLDVLIRALQAYVSYHVAPAWGTPALIGKATDYVPGAWALVFLDAADAPDALAYHDLTPDGMPQGKVFVRTARDEGQPLSVVASHELVEMLVDPGLNLLSTGPDAGTVYAYEVADPVQAVKFAVHGLPMSDFVYPAYFEGFRPAGSAAFDHVRAVTTPFEILPGGYQNAMTNGGWTQLFGADDARGRSALTSVRGRRSERRALVTLQRADAQAIARAA